MGTNRADDHPGDEIAGESANNGTRAHTCVLFFRACRARAVSYEIIARSRYCVAILSVIADDDDTTMTTTQQ